MTVKLCAPQVGKSGIWVVEVGRAKLGLSPQSEWSMQLREETHAMVKPQDMTFVLPLLEIGRPALYSHLQAISNERPNIAPHLKRFPEELLLRCAFETSVSDYWPLKGIEWLESSPELIAQFKAVLSNLQKRSWATQIFKQKINSTLKNGSAPSPAA